MHAAANDSTRLYNPKADAAKEVAQLLVKAQKENKKLLLQVGGNWCVMCYRLNYTLQTDTTIKKILADNFIVYHVNYSPENKNERFLKSLDNPQRFGFPVLVVLAPDGNRLHTQSSGGLQKGNGYDAEKITSFLQQWSVPATSLSHLN